jgi:serine protease Do
MRALRLPAAVLLLIAAVGVALADRPDRAKPAVEFTDDTKLLDDFTKKLGEVVKADKGMKSADLKAAVEDKKKATAKVTPAKPGDRPLPPEEVGERVRASVFLFGSVIGDKENGFDQGRMATAWAATADGVLVTNWHVFDQIEDEEHYGAMGADGAAYPLVEVLAIDKAADVAVVKIAAKGLTPLPLADKPAKVGAWVGVLGHPGDRYYTFTQGHVSRYSTYTEDDDTKTRWMSITADYAYGSSGSPVVDRFGNVVGMAALTENIDYPDNGGAPEKAVRKSRQSMVRRAVKLRDDDKKKEEKKEEKKDAAPAPTPSALQMVVKLTVPAADVRAVLTEKE